MASRHRFPRTSLTAAGPESTGLRLKLSSSSTPLPYSIKEEEQQEEEESEELEEDDELEEEYGEEEVVTTRKAPQSLSQIEEQGKKSVGDFSR